MKSYSGILLLIDTSIFGGMPFDVNPFELLRHTAHQDSTGEKSALCEARDNDLPYRGVNPIQNQNMQLQT